jgi:hypothetical protein
MAISDSDAIKKAIKWISSAFKEGSTKSDSELINEAMLKFDLNPLQSEYLLQNLKKVKNGEM